MGSNLKPDYGIKPRGNRDLCLTEAIPNPTPTPTDGSPLADNDKLHPGEAMVVGDDAPTKTRQEFFEALIIDRAPEEVRHKDKPTSSSTPEEIAAYRTRVLNHKLTCYRFVFQVWPRDPSGPPIRQAPNNVQIWGATLFDFYMVCRFPSVQNLMAFSSGSKLARWMKEQGETYAQDFVERQEEEADPHIIFPCDIGRLIRDGEAMLFEKSWTKVDDKGKGKKRNPGSFQNQWWPPASPFHPTAYPHPWPRQPFANDFRIRVPALQQYIMQSLLPKKLVVHDPWKLLNVKYINRDEFKRQQRISWDEKRDITHVYNLKNSDENKKRKETDDAEAKANEEKQKKVHEVFLGDPHSKNELPSGYVISQGEDEPGPCKPPVFVVLPYLPNREQPEEAHLYIAPVSKIGEGNHSYIYNAELELPRNQLINEEICHQCVLEDMCCIIHEQDGEHNERRDPKWDIKSGKHVVKTIQKPEVVTTVPNTDTGPYCKHLQKLIIHPLTSKVGVAAKLSIQGDSHLAREAENYQAFPRHFFQHWSGYNIINPLHDPTPVGPVVPQFYGYYVVDQDEEKRIREEREADRKKRREERAQKNQGGEKQETPQRELPMGADSQDMEIEEKGNGEQEDQKDASAMEIDGERDNMPSQESESRPSSKEQIPDSKEQNVGNRSMSEERENKEEKGDNDNDDEDEGGQEDQDQGEEEEEEENNPYLSPILLLENCGTPIDPENLSVDDITESGSLAYHFHKEGWVHGSLATRNILRQPGPLSAWPSERMVNMMDRGGIGKDWGFRLIDFGRSYKLADEELGHPSNALICEGSMISGWVHGWGNSLP